MTFMEAGKILDDFVIWHSGLTSVEADLLIENPFEVSFRFCSVSERAWCYCETRRRLSSSPLVPLLTDD